jgi:hypothetical protein
LMGDNRCSMSQAYCRPVSTWRGAHDIWALQPDRNTHDRVEGVRRRSILRASLYARRIMSAINCIRNSLFSI